MVVDFQGNVLAYQGVTAGLYEEVALVVLDGRRLSGKRRKILLQLGAKLRILLGPRSKGDDARTYSQDKLFHSFTPFGMNAE